MKSKCHVYTFWTYFREFDLTSLWVLLVHLTNCDYIALIIPAVEPYICPTVIIYITNCSPGYISIGSISVSHARIVAIYLWTLIGKNTPAVDQMKSRMVPFTLACQKHSQTLEYSYWSSEISSSYYGTKTMYSTTYPFHPCHIHNASMVDGYTATITSCILQAATRYRARFPLVPEFPWAVMLKMVICIGMLLFMNMFNLPAVNDNCKVSFSVHKLWWYQEHFLPQTWPSC